MDSLVFWCGTLWTSSVEKRMQAAETGGFTELSIFPTDVPDAVSDPSAATRIRDLESRYGVDVTVLDALTQWLPGHSPPSSPDGSSLTDFDEDEFFALGEALDIDSLTVIEPFDSRVDTESAAEAFGRVCDRAADHGWRVHLEFIPFSGIPDLQTAWEIVDAADRDNGGLLFDTWHYYRGDTDPDLLKQIPGEKIYRVQVSDAPATFDRSLRKDSLHHRRLPGEGDVELAGQLQTLASIGGLQSVGIEAISDDLHAQPPVDVGRKSGETLRSLLADVGVDLP